MNVANVNFEAEQALLGACLVNNEAMDLVEGTVRPEDFSEPVHVLVFDAFRNARNEGRRIDVTLMKSLLGAESANRLLVPGMTTGDYIAKLAAAATTVVNAPDYAQAVAEAANYRRLKAAGELLAQRAAAGYASGSPAQVASSIIGDLDQVITAAASHGNRRVSMGEAVDAAYEAMLERTEHGVEQGVTPALPISTR